MSGGVGRGDYGERGTMGTGGTYIVTHWEYRKPGMYG
jgi:hypothetical protein